MYKFNKWKYLESCVYYTCQICVRYVFYKDIEKYSKIIKPYNGRNARRDRKCFI